MSDHEFISLDYVGQLKILHEWNELKAVMLRYGAHTVAELEALLKKGSKTPVINKVEYYVSEDGTRIVGKREPEVE